MTRQQALQIAKPILFSTDMVRAILDGRKTVTRRIIKPQPPKEANGTYERMDNGKFQLKVEPYENIYDYEINPPYQIGDILYVRETYWKCIDGEYLYRADFLPNREKGFIRTWKPSIHMPKEAAQIFLRVTDVRVERLQDITREQVLKEGIRATAANVFDLGNDYITEGIDRGVFQTLWNSTVKKSDLDKYGWNANPWVWVIEFEKLEVTQR
ncbi:MAG: hypothetical protein NC452_04010 [Eubacterium sp.]|nr:hypothetical protein [Eubacterium sp.]